VGILLQLPFPLCTALPFSSVRSVPFRSALRSRHDSSTFLLLLLPLPLRLRLRLLVKVPALLGPLSQSMLTAAAAPAARESQSCGVATFGEFRFSPSCSDSNLANFKNIFFLIFAPKILKMIFCFHLLTEFYLIKLYKKYTMSLKYINVFKFWFRNSSIASRIPGKAILLLQCSFKKSKSPLIARVI